jgi:hypothetical protein
LVGVGTGTKGVSGWRWTGTLVRSRKDTGGKFFREGFWGSTFLALSVASGFVDGERGGSDRISRTAASE